MFRSSLVVLAVACLFGGTTFGAEMDTTIPCPSSGCIPEPANSLSKQAWAEYLDGHIESSYVMFQEILQSSPQDSLARVGFVLATMRLGNNGEAISAVKKILVENPRDAAAASAYGHLMQAKLNADIKAINDDSCWFWMGRSVKLDSNSAEGWSGYWVEAMMRANEKEAERALRNLARLGLWSPATLALDRLVLESCPMDAVLILGGDGDYMGIHQLQVLGGLRTDIRMEGPFLDSPRYLKSRIRAGKFPATLTLAKVDSILKDTESRLPVSARITSFLHSNGSWPTVAISWTKGVDNWGAILSEGRSTYFNTILDSTNGADVSLDNQKNVQIFLDIDPAVFAGQAYSECDLSPIRRRTKSFNAVFFVQATKMMHQEQMDGRHQNAKRLGIWRNQLRKAVPNDDRSFHEVVIQIEKLEKADTKNPKSPGSPQKSKLKSKHSH